MKKKELQARVVAMAMTGVLALGLLAGCGNEAKESTEAETTATQQTETASESETEPVTEAQKDDGVMRTMTAMEYAKDMGIGWNLGNTMEAYYKDENNHTAFASAQGTGQSAWRYETCWGATATTQQMIDGIRDDGFKTIRVPVYWGNMMADDGTFTINEIYMNRVKEIVDFCRNDNLYVVINIHHYDEMLIKNLPQEDVLKATDLLWTQIATEFADYSDYLIFEGFNEAVGSKRDEDKYTTEETYAYVNALNQTFVDAVRRTGGNNANRLLIVSGYWTNIDNTTNALYQMPTDTVADKLMVSVHYVDNIMFWSNQIGGQKWLDYTEQQCELLKTRFTDNNIPVFMGETTSKYPSDRFAGDAIYTDSSECVGIVMKKLAVEYGFVPVLWDTPDGFYNRKFLKISNESDQAMIEDVLKAIEEQ